MSHKINPHRWETTRIAKKNYNKSFVNFRQNIFIQCGLLQIQTLNKYCGAFSPKLNNKILLSRAGCIVTKYKYNTSASGSIIYSWSTYCLWRPLLLPPVRLSNVVIIISIEIASLALSIRWREECLASEQRDGRQEGEGRGERGEGRARR